MKDSILSNIKENRFFEDFTLKILLFFFVVSAFAFSSIGILPIAVFLLFAFSIGSMLSHYKKNKLEFPIALKFLNIWVLWSFLSGLFVATNYDLFIEGFILLLTNVLIANFVYFLLAMKPNLLFTVLTAVIIAGIIQVFSIYLGFQTEDIMEKKRQSGLSSNPNSFGIKLVFSSMAILYLFVKKKSLHIFKGIILLLVLGLFFQSIIDSASRKSLLSFTLLIILFFAFKLSNQKIKFSISKFLTVLVVLFSTVVIIIPLILSGTHIEERIENTQKNGGLEGDIRYDMYKFGIELVSDNPIFGIGINNYRELYKHGLYSHSDYIESLTSTGIVGFLLYQLFYFYTIYECFRLVGKKISQNLRLLILLSLLNLIILKIIATGLIQYIAPTSFIIVVSIIALNKQVKKIITQNDIISS